MLCYAKDSQVVPSFTEDVEAQDTKWEVLALWAIALLVAHATFFSVLTEHASEGTHHQHLYDYG